MASNHSDGLQFKFKWLDNQGNESGFLRKRGRLTNDALLLDQTEIPVVVIMHSLVRDNRLVLTALGADGQPVHFAVSVSGIGAGELKSAIDSIRSRGWANFHKEDLKKQGREHAYRDAECPHCHATIVLTDFATTPQLYCRFCDTLSTVDPALDPPPGEKALKVCDECGMFSRPRKFTVFYFYFLVAVYGWRYRITWRCPACMRKDAWKMFFGNLPFVVGVPVALTQIARSHGGSMVGPFAGLDKANIKARQGDALGALAGYRAILERIPHSAGVKYNLGLALLKQGEVRHAADTFRLALQDCCNHIPAYQMLAQCYEQLGEKEQLAELKRLWGTAEEKEPEEVTTFVE